MSGGAGDPGGVGVISIPPGEVLDLRAALDRGGSVPGRDLRTGLFTSVRLPDPDWLDAHADSFDVAHVHLGVGAMSPVELAHVLVRLRARAKPVVLTVHQLEHAYLAQPALDELLEIAVPTADEIVTFTVGAAREILRRWGRVAHILPHPPVIPERLATRQRPRHRGFVVGVDVTGGCGLGEAWEAVEAVTRALAGFENATLRVDVDTEIMTPGWTSHRPALAERALDLRAHGDLDLRFHDQRGIDELATYLQDLDAFVLPLQRGTHSSWVEACHDVGTTAIVPDQGHVSEQRPCLTYRVSEPDSLTLALRTAADARHSRRPRSGERAADLDFVALAHRELYLSLVEPQRLATSTARVLQTQDPH